MSAPPHYYVPGTAAKFAGWLAGSLMGLTILAVLSARLPVEAKPLGLFLIGCGALAGWGIGQLAFWFGLRFQRVILVATTIMIAGGLVGGTLDNYRILNRPMRQEFAKVRAADLQDPLDAATKQFLQDDGSKDTPEVREAREQFLAMVRRRDEKVQSREEQRQFILSFPGYLAHRVSKEGNWPQPWPMVFWWTEVLIGSAFGGWLSVRAVSRPYCSACSSWDDVTLTLKIYPPQTKPALPLLEVPESFKIDPAVAQVTVKFMGCGCPDKLSGIRCEVEQPAQPKQGWSIANPTLQKRQDILRLMASESPLY